MGPTGGSRKDNPNNPWLSQYGSSWRNLSDHVKRLNFSSTPIEFVGGGPRGGSQQFLLSDVPPPWVATRHGGGPYRSRTQATRELRAEQKRQNPRLYETPQERYDREYEERRAKLQPSSVIAAAGADTEEVVKKRKKKEIKQGVGAGVTTGASSTTSILGTADTTRPELLGS